MTPLVKTKKIVIYSCPRSGTHYIRELLSRSKLQIQFEKEPEVFGHGLVSWKAINHPEILTRKGLIFLHQVRDPLMQIASFLGHGGNKEPETYSQIYKHLGEHQEAFRTAKLWDRYLIFYVAWNERIEKEVHKADGFHKVYRVEDVDLSFLEEIMSLLGVTRDRALLVRALIETSKETDSGGREISCSWDLFTEGDYLEKCRDMAERYGYFYE